MDHEVKGHIQEVLIRCILGKAGDSDYREAYDWVHASQENKAFFDSLYAAWLAAGLTQSVDYKIQERVWNGVNPDRQMTTAKHKIINKRGWVSSFLKIAALFALVLSLTIFSYSYLQKKHATNELYTVEAPKGSKSRITLSDGSQVWLNAGSKIQYYANYNRTFRDIYLAGEAYFEVAKNRSKPFKVHAGGIVVNALGTSFNVKAYPEEKIVETTLVEGLVSIVKAAGRDNKEPLLLGPNQHAVYYKAQSVIKVDDPTSNSSSPVADEQKFIHIKPGKILLSTKVIPEIYTSWKDKRWVFHSEPFGDFILKLERLYDIDIIIEDPALKDYKLTGSIEEENIEMVLKALQLIIPIKYELGHKQLIIRTDFNLKKEFDQSLKKPNY